jgi:hypothetical protein
MWMPNDRKQREVLINCTKYSDSGRKADKSRTATQYGVMIKINNLVWCWLLAGNAKPGFDKRSASVNF